MSIVVVSQNCLQSRRSPASHPRKGSVIPFKELEEAKMKLLFC